MLPDIRQTTAIKLTKGLRRDLEKMHDAHMVELAQDRFAAERAAERLENGRDLVGLASSLLTTMGLAEASLAAQNPHAAGRIAHMADRFTVSAGDLIDTYMRRPL
jgi:hypothetical protein